MTTAKCPYCGHLFDVVGHGETCNEDGFLSIECLGCFERVDMWAQRAIDLLNEGQEAIVRPKGHSMKGKVESGQRVTLEPVSSSDVNVGDIVLCRVKGNVYLHLVKAVDKKRFLIGNNRGGTNGWTGTIYGKAVKIED